jgi:myo-inositol 2-dehydrogenase/D-chiro-inositol 1-dehydrogenase
VQTGILPEAAASTWDGYAAALVADTGVRALHSGVKERVEMIKKPAFYA